MGLATRFFLRRLAAERRRLGADAASSLTYWSALAWTVVVFAVLPARAVVSCVGILGEARAPETLGRALAQFSRAGWWAPVVVVLIVGLVTLNLKFRRFRNDSGACLAFDSARDRHITWAQFALVCLGTAAVPWCVAVAERWMR